MHNSGILDRQYWANQKIKNCENMKKNDKRRSGKKKQSNAAQTPRTQRRRREKNIDNQAKNSAQSQRSKLAADALRVGAVLKVSAQN